MGEGFEEIEAITVYDVVKRIGKKAQFVSIGDDVTVRGSNGAELRCDKCISDFTLDDVDALVLPGGLHGASNLRGCAALSLFPSGRRWCAPGGSA